MKEAENIQKDTLKMLNFHGNIKKQNESFYIGSKKVMLLNQESKKALNKQNSGFFFGKSNNKAEKREIASVRDG